MSGAWDFNLTHTHTHAGSDDSCSNLNILNVRNLKAKSHGCQVFWQVYFSGFCCLLHPFELAAQQHTGCPHYWSSLFSNPPSYSLLSMGVWGLFEFELITLCRRSILHFTNLYSYSISSLFIHVFTAGHKSSAFHTNASICCYKLLHLPVTFTISASTPVF